MMTNLIDVNKLSKSKLGSVNWKEIRYKPEIVKKGFYRIGNKE